MSNPDEDGTSCYLVEVTLVQQVGNEWRAATGNLSFEVTALEALPDRAHQALAEKFEKRVYEYSPVQFSIRVEIGRQLNGEQRYLVLCVQKEDQEMFESVMQSMARAA